MSDPVHMQTVWAARKEFAVHAGAVSRADEALVERKRRLLFASVQAKQRA